MAGALIAASVAAQYAYRAFKLERQRDIDRESDAERNHQATLVAAWQPAKEDHGYLANYSRLPIRAEQITFVSRFRDGQRYTYSHDHIDKVPNRGFFEPETKTELPWPADLPVDELLGGMTPRDDYNDYLTVEVQLRDTRGVVWFLDGEGFLSKVAERRSGSRPGAGSDS